MPRLWHIVHLHVSNGLEQKYSSLKLPINSNGKCMSCVALCADPHFQQPRDRCYIRTELYLLKI